jgi:hypothetical protein
VPDAQFPDLIARVELAFHLFERAQADDALSLLKQLEIDARTMSSHATGSRLVEWRHALIWILLTRGALLLDHARYGESDDDLTTAKTLVDEWELECQDDRADCYFFEYAQLSLLASKGYVNRGRFNEAIDALLPLARDVSAKHHAQRLNFEQRVEGEINDCGEALGYFNIYSRLVRPSPDPDLKDTLPNNEGWRNPLPLRGPVWQSFAGKLDALEREVSPVRSSKLLSELELRDRKDLILQDWIKAVPFSIEAKYLALVNLFAITQIEIQLDLFETFMNSLQRLKDSISVLKVQAPQYVDLYRIVGSGFVQLGTTIMNHKFDEDATWRSAFGIATESIVVAFENFEESRLVMPVTQATALIACVNLNAYAKACEMVDDRKVAVRQRVRRDAILRHILRHDPLNGRAKNLWEKYEHSKNWTRFLLSAEVEKWHWSIAPIP